MVNRKISVAELVFDHKGYSGYYSTYCNNRKESSGTFESAEELSFCNVQPTAVMLSGNIVIVREIEAATKDEAFEKISGLGIEAEHVFISWIQVSPLKGFLAMADKNRCIDLLRELEENRIRPSHFLIAPFFIKKENEKCDTGTWTLLFEENKLVMISRGPGRPGEADPLAQQLFHVLKNKQEPEGRISIPAHEALLKEKRLEHNLFKFCLLLSLILLIVKFYGSFVMERNNKHGAGLLSEQSAEQDSIRSRITESKERIKALGLRRSLNSAKVIDKISATLPEGIRFRDLKMTTIEESGELEIRGDCRDRQTLSEWLSAVSLNWRSGGSELVTPSDASAMSTGLQFTLKIQL